MRTCLFFVDFKCAPAETFIMSHFEKDKCIELNNTEQIWMKQCRVWTGQAARDGKNDSGQW